MKAEVRQTDFLLARMDSIDPGRELLTWVLYDEATKHREAIEGDLRTLETELWDKDLALQVLCGAILQIGKQMISVVHGRLRDCPPGERLHRLPWSSGMSSGTAGIRPCISIPGCTIPSCHASLSWPPSLDRTSTRLATPGRSKAKQVLRVLGWTSCHAYLKDMWNLQ